METRTSYPTVDLTSKCNQYRGNMWSSRAFSSRYWFSCSVLPLPVNKFRIIYNAEWCYIIYFSLIAFSKTNKDIFFFYFLLYYLLRCQGIVWIVYIFGRLPWPWSAGCMGSSKDNTWQNMDKVNWNPDTCNPYILWSNSSLKKNPTSEQEILIGKQRHSQSGLTTWISGKDRVFIRRWMENNKSDGLIWK